MGRMVEKGSGGTYSQFVFRPSGDMLAVYSGGLTKGTIPLPGGSTAIYNATGLNYIRHTDWLGSSRFATTWAHAVYSKEAYAPFGETYNEAGTPDRSFTGQDQDVATGNLGNGVYDFLFRKYDPSAGRWLSPDPAGWGAVDATDPQSLDRYAYVENQPMSLVDPNGLYWCVSGNVSTGGDLQVDPGMLCYSDGYGALVMDNPGPGQKLTNGEVWSMTQNGSQMSGIYTWVPDYIVSYNGGNMMNPQSYYVTQGSGGKTSGSVLGCMGQAIAANKLEVGLDALGLIPVESTIVKSATMAALVVKGGIDVLNRDGTGVGLSLTGFVVAILDAEKVSLGKAAGEAIPFVGTIVAGAAVANDIFGSEAYQSCREGH